MGRPRKTIEEHIRNGTYRPSKHGPKPGEGDTPAEPASMAGKSPVSAAIASEMGETPEPVEPPPAKPVGLGSKASRVWDEVLPLLGDRLRQRDVLALVDLCRWVVRMDVIAAELEIVEPSEKGYKDLLISAGIATTNFERYCSRFGLTLADRMKLKLDKVQSGPVKPKILTRPKTANDSQGRPK